MKCFYCGNRAIGYENSYGMRDITPVWGRLYVCRDCAHVDATVYLHDGDTFQQKD